MSIKGYLFGDKIVIFDINDSKKLYSTGFYGKPLGINKPKKAEDIKYPLELSLIEGLYLLKKGEIEVIYNGNKLNENDLYEIGRKNIARFDSLFTVYSDLRNKGFVVRSGIKFGADFAIYTLGPGIEHAPYVVIVLDANSTLLANELMSFGRVSHSTRKKLILAIVNVLSPKNIRYVMFKWVKL
ncbi:tRNA-intron lyase [Acidianus ambivalens]|uniref:tRNA-splicing endonuclease n=1 Tax=Acidianus ambivalens TaxID=2283 RepID=A0A650CYL2_ACIAM|nr:tRNA-intron lyase [Acidianus ambivalens]MQL54680.1 tRNA-intron lyase [Acidianus ambivalens]QGR22933.1 tRNA-intron lyase [Acidianus ambivalens]